MIGTRSFTFDNEDALQSALALILKRAGLTVEREVRIDERNRIDLIVERVGIEVKVKGAGPEVARQLQRYASSGLFDELILVTHRADHARFFPDKIGDVPLSVVWIGGAL